MPEPRPISRPVDRLAAAVEGAAVLDAPAQKLAKVLRGALSPGAVKDGLSGTWLGHPLHPVLTDTVIGTWTSALLLDLSRDRHVARGADRLVGAGIAAAVPTALTGMTDWADGEPAADDVRRVGAVHAAGNVVALGLQVASLAARRRGARGRGVALSLAANGMLAVSGWLGGHLSYAQGLGVDQTRFDPGDEDWADALGAADLGSDPVSVQVGDTPVLLVRDAGVVRALHDRCSHRGCSLAEGTVQEGVVQCGCHGSRFSLHDGAVLRGPALLAQPAFDAREREGRIEVRRRTPAGV
ncbi:MAG TPA: Rieske 2Fe-2S domain-containing protein [Baekduia sp.]|nr:Rieske 2Fe-2S domain-containing protein [Baekduia sp.]